MEEILNYIGIGGAFALAMSGALKAMGKKFDPFGVLIIAFVTAVGGGTLRDILLEDRTVFWLTEVSYIYFIIAGAVIALIFRKRLAYFHKTLLFFDAIGLALYTIMGVQIGIEFELSFINCIIMGTLTGAFGGVVRDILVNEIPVIFRKEIYATVSIVGGMIYWGLVKLEVGNVYAQIIPIMLIIIARLFIMYYKVSFPTIYRDEK
ncbi:MAG: hypothetical protein C0599_16110 [Salinivirgaceae bacterium]|nr:MAG: hypothetical protein C0599_16110 [Salinivirgaceae bacterium]